MYQKTWFTLVISVLVMLLAFGCGGDDDNATGGDNNTTTPETPSVMENINVPVDNLIGSGNIYGTQAAMYVAMAQAYSSFLTPPASSVAKHDAPTLALSDSTIYTWSNGQLSIIMTWQETATEYIWICQIDGYDESSGTTYDNFTFIECHEQLNGSNGWMEIYNPDETGAVFRWVWTEVAGVFTMTLTLVDGLDTATAIIVVNADGSGNVEYNDSDGDYWKVTWNSAGTSGEWETNSESGTWTYSG